MSCQARRWWSDRVPCTVAGAMGGDDALCATCPARLLTPPRVQQLALFFVTGGGWRAWTGAPYDPLVVA